MVTGRVIPKETPARAPTRQRLPVRWHESRQRADYNAEYLSIGSMPGLIRDSFKDDETVRKLLCDSVVLSRRSREIAEVDEHVRLVSALVLKLLQRGRMPLPTLEIERSAILAFDLDKHIVDLSKGNSGDLGWETKTGRPYNINRDQFIARLSERCHFELETEFQEPLLDSSYELDFMNRWMPQHLGDDAGHWITPQAPLDTLIESNPDPRNSIGNDRRVDFLVHHPGFAPFVIEIDGPEHLEPAAVAVDRRRDASIKRSTGMDVIRVTNQEVTPGPSPKLEHVKKSFHTWKQQRRNSHPDEVAKYSKIADFARTCSIGSKIQFVIAKAVDQGWLTGSEWNLDICGGGPAVSGAVLDALRMFTAYDTLYGGKSRPDLCRLRTDDGPVRAWRLNEWQWSEIQDPEFDEPHLTILIESDSSPYDKMARRDADFIVRTAFLPVEFSVELHSDFPRTKIPAESYGDAEPALTFFLQNVFRKQNFRSGQGESIWRTLRQEDTIVLLPTGGGKSIIYQLSGLLMPGITLVIDPIVALIEDQVEGLYRYGIERVTGISSALNLEERQSVLRRAELGEFQFMLMAPERLQSPEFRSTIRALRASSLINLAVIDEAHCVSEWGHEFRPAYLRLAETLRDIGGDRGGEAPPLLALTGTASRAVLKDLMNELGFDRSRSDNVVRPTSFDRKELRFEIRRERTSRNSMDALRGVMQSLPNRFPGQSNFFDDASGIVFVRTVNAPEWGMIATCDAVSDATKVPVTMYSGGTVPDGHNPRDWEVVKRDNARAFKDDKVPILVATKSFGMGIDKPNIRFVVHNGMPGSIESFYQEAGRAGRDGNTAWCIAITSEFDQTRTDKLLNPNSNLDEIRNIHKTNGGDWNRMDDVTSAIFFHLNSFRGVREEIQEIERILNQLGSMESAQSVEVNWSTQTQQRRIEFAIVRLMRAGVVSDYTVDWNRGLFQVDVPEFDFDQCRSKVVDYVRIAQPRRTQVFAEQIESLPDRSPHKNAMAIVTAMIDFTYDVIERSRRRAIQETVFLARNETDDEGVRRRITDYLQEGVHAERIDELLTDTSDNLEGWWELIEKMQAAVDSDELRGLAIRFLESYPDDPGLLFTRAASEAMCSDRDDRVCVENFTFAIQSGVRYLTRPKNIHQLIDNLFDFSKARVSVLAPLLVIGLLNLEANAEIYRSLRTQAYEHAINSSQPETATIAAAFSVGDAVADAADLVGKWQKRFTPKSLQLLGLD